MSGAIQWIPRVLPSMKFVALALAAFVVGIAACSTVPSPEQRQASAVVMASSHGWRSDMIASQPFQLAIWQPASIEPRELLTVYVEGDGLSWLSPTVPSNDPTPVNPVALKLAMAQSRGNAVYIVRPCQFGGIADPNCEQIYWTGKRFSSEVIVAMSAAVDVLKARFGAKKLILVGYSGGAAVTALLAQRRSDIAAWITVAGNIDHRAWTQHHGMTPLHGSLDPMVYAAKLASLPQWHFVGARDHIVPSQPTHRFVQTMLSARVITIEDYDHACCWHLRWAADLDKIMNELAMH